MISEAFSATIITGAFKFPLVISGRTDASATLMPSSPCIFNFWSTTADLSKPIFRVHEG